MQQVSPQEAFREAILAFIRLNSPHRFFGAGQQAGSGAGQQTGSGAQTGAGVSQQTGAGALYTGAGV